MIKGWSKFQAVCFTDIKVLEQADKVTRDSAGIVRAVESPVTHESDYIRTGRKRSLSHDHYSIVMQPVGLRGVDAMPKNEAQGARTAHGCLHGLEALHKVTSLVRVFCNVHRCMSVTSIACPQLSILPPPPEQLHELL